MYREQMFRFIEVQKSMVGCFPTKDIQSPSHPPSEVAQFSWDTHSAEAKEKSIFPFLCFLFF